MITLSLSSCSEGDIVYFLLKVPVAFSTHWTIELQNIHQFKPPTRAYLSDCKHLSCYGKKIRINMPLHNKCFMQTIINNTFEKSIWGFEYNAVLLN